MKNLKKIMITFVLALAVLFSGSISASAEVTQTKDTTATIIFKEGLLEIVQAPSFDFGEQTISRDVTRYPAVNTLVPLQVSDARGSNEGWKVNAKLSGFLLDETDPTLSGSSIELSNGTVAAAGGTIGSGPVAAASISIPSDDSVVPIERAVSGTGMGLWNTTWTNAQAELKIATGTAEVGSSKATLNWILENTP